MDDQDQTNEVFGVSFIDILACTTGGLIFVTVMLVGLLAFKSGERTGGREAQEVRGVTAEADGLWIGNLGVQVPLEELKTEARQFRDWLHTLPPETIVGFNVDLGGADSFREGARICGEEKVPWVRVDEGNLQQKELSCRAGKVVIEGSGTVVMVGDLSNPGGAFHSWLRQLSPDKHFVLLILYPDGHESFRAAKEQLDIAGFVSRVAIQ